MSFVPNGKKPGRPKDATLDIYRQLFGDVWSARTIARYRVCMKRLSALGIDGEHPTFAALHKRCSRPNGTLNVARLDEITECMAAMAAARLVHVQPDTALEAAS